MVQETFVIEEGEKTLEDLIEEQRAKLHREGKQARSRPARAGGGCVWGGFQWQLNMCYMRPP